MPKLTYLLIQTAIAAHTPIAVSGNSGRLYGHSMFDKAHNAHVFRVDQETYEGQMARDIALVGHRSFGKWIIKAEIEADPESAEGQLAQELDESRATVDQLKLQLTATEAELATLRSLLSSPAETAQTPESPAGDTDSNDTQTASVEEVATEEPISELEPIPTSGDPVRAALEAQSFRDLRAQAKAAGIDVVTINTKVGLIEALLAFPSI